MPLSTILVYGMAKDVLQKKDVFANLEQCKN